MPMTECLIERVRYVALGAVNLSQAVEFYRDAWGLQEGDRDANLTFLGAPQAVDPYILRLRQSEHDRLDLISLAVVNAEAVESVYQSVVSAGAQVVQALGELATPGGGFGFRFFDPDGRVLEISSDVELVRPQDVTARDWHPMKLSHVVINTPTLADTSAWYVNTLGMPISDRLADKMIFLHGANNVHHTIALAEGPRSSMNHVAFECLGIDEFLRAAGRLMRSGVETAWGPGRHGPGDNTFAYFSDPSGYVVEYTTALEIVDDWSTWEPTTHDMTSDSSDQWGTASLRKPEPFLGPVEASLFQAPPI